MKSWRVGFIGAGFNSIFHLRALERVRGVVVTGVFAPAGAEELAVQANARGLGECQVFSTIAELCQNCDIVAICSPNFARLENMEEIVAAVRAGAPVKAVICEKPLGRTVDEARRMVELAASVNLLTAYFENQIFMPAITTQMIQLRPQLASMGPLALARSAEEHGGPHQGWFWDPTKSGGGVLGDMGCHSIAVAWYALTPFGKPPTFLQPQSVNCSLGLLKWGLPAWREKLKQRFKVDYALTPAEDYATGTVTFQNPETGQNVVAQFADSWMFEKQGLRLSMEGMGPGYAFDINTLSSVLNLFIGDAAAEAVADGESALEKATATRGLLAVQPDEAELYGYAAEWRNALAAFARENDGLLNWSYGVEITRLVQAAYMAHERGITLDLTDAAVRSDLEVYRSLIAQGRGAEVLSVP